MTEDDAMMLQLLGLQTSKSCTTLWLSASLDHNLRRLFHLSSLITKSSTRDKFARAGLKCRLAFYEPYDIQHIQEKVAHARGQADNGLLKRLGKANTSRRQFLAYASAHNAELAGLGRQGTTIYEDRATNGHHGPGDKCSVGQSVIQSEMTKQSAAPTKASTLGPVDLGACDHNLDDARSCTTMATSIVDGQAFSGLKVPELTHYAEPGEHFHCPICQTVQRFSGQTAWRWVLIQTKFACVDSSVKTMSIL
jgi:hypothetical protein